MPLDIAVNGRLPLALVSVVAWERCARPWPVVAAITASWLVPHADVLLPTDTAAAIVKYRARPDPPRAVATRDR